MDPKFYVLRDVATGKFLKRVGEKIEEQAEKPVPPLEDER
jgi:hypothetical protein